MCFRHYALLFACAFPAACQYASSDAALEGALSPAEARAIAKEAFIYGYPMIDSYRIQYAYFLSPGNPQHKGALNEIINVPRVYTDKDTTVQTPNSDTPYSFIGFDLRAEPLVLGVPEIEPTRYYSLQFIDAYTFNFAYVGSRATGNGAGKYLLVGPGWKGKRPDGVTKIIRADTEQGFVVYRTQLFGPDDLDNVKKIQAGYTVEPLSRFSGTPAPKAAPVLEYPKPVTPAGAATPLTAFGVLDFVLRFCPTDPSETALMKRFAKIGVGAGRPFDPARLTPEIRAALKGGIEDGWAAYEEFKRTRVDTGKVTSGEIFGTRAFLKNNYLYRMAAAILGIYGNSEFEAMYPIYTVDESKKPLDGKDGRYTIRFAPDRLPPVNAFWSLTMYKLPSSLLVANPIERFLINSPMLPELVKDADGGITLYIQADSPGEERESNWLPAPEGPFFMALRLYWPKDEALKGTWTPPPAERAAKD